MCKPFRGHPNAYNGNKKIFFWHKKKFTNLCDITSKKNFM